MWSKEYKKSIDCDNPKGFSQRAHCQGRKKKVEEQAKGEIKYSKFSHKTPHLKGKQHQLDPNLDMKQLVHHSTVQYVDRDADGDVDVFDKTTPDELPGKGNFAKQSKQLMKKQKGELKHTKVGLAYEGNLHQWFKGSKSKDGKPGWVNVVTGGTCASDEPGEGVPKCVSSAKRASMTKSERLSASRRKKSADKGQQQKSGAAKPTYVSTDKPEKKMKESVERGPILPKEKGKRIFPKGQEPKPTGAKLPPLQKAHFEPDGNLIDETKDVKSKGSGKKDACYNKVKSRYDVWPSAYASGALVKCRKVGAANWGNKKEGYTYEFNDDYHSNLIEKCWKGYTQKGMKKKGDKMVPNCVPVNEKVERYNELGQTVAVTLKWRGKVYFLQMFFPTRRFPNRNEVEAQVQKIYPDAVVMMAVPSSVDPTKPTIRVAEESDALEKAVMNPKHRNPKGTPQKPRGGDKRPVEEETCPVCNQDPCQCLDDTLEEGAAWTKKSGKNPKGGLNEKGRKSYERENPGSDLKAPSKKVGNPRRASFCARMKGMKAKLTSAKTANDPDSRINKSLRAWNC